MTADEWRKTRQVYKENSPASLYEHSKPSLGIKSREMDQPMLGYRPLNILLGGRHQSNHMQKLPSIKPQAEVAIFRDKAHQLINLAEVAILGHLTAFSHANLAEFNCP
ncbi:hypothetical protein MTR_7g073405 [Medicago truncatula]|uniref:Uncharacterized protein n=1 Tax=Medicago truncatula TaxID=3880 RepID=A0A072U0H0_MEDTR|nr:hypothetical protein MTR_7g073405 [Medicago truncatula]